ncbi:MAG: serine hydrolase domain-containing protein, partial [Anaerolineales bacterium]
MFHKSKLVLILIIIGMLLSACGLLQAPTATPIPEEVVEDIDVYMADLADQEKFSGAVLIAQGDDVLLSAGYGMADVENDIPNSPQTRYHIGSVTKQFTAVAVLIMHAQGKYELDDPVCEYVPGCPDHWKAITIHQLLTHTSGLPDSGEFYEGKNEPGVSYKPDEIIGWFKEAPLDFEPGEKFAYSSTGYLLLGILIEQVSGQSYEEFLQSQIFEPLGMTNTGYPHDDTGLAVGYRYVGFEAEFINPSLPYSAGGLYSTVEDLYRWDRSFYTGELLPQELIEKIFTPVVSTQYFPYAPPYDEVGYGYGWFIGERLGHRAAGHGGTYTGFRALIEHYPDDEIAIIIMSNLQSSEIKV